MGLWYLVLFPFSLIGSTRQARLEGFGGYEALTSCRSRFHVYRLILDSTPYSRLPTMYLFVSIHYYDENDITTFAILDEYIQ